MILTVKKIQEAMKSDDFWMNTDSYCANVINQAVKEGYVLRLSHTQVQWKDQEAIDRLDNLVKIEKVDELVKKYTADEIFETIEEMFESECSKRMFLSYEHVVKSKSAMIRKVFQKGYRFGNKIAYELLLEEGFKVLNELHVSSMLDNRGFDVYTIYDYTIFVIKSNYENSKPNRRQFAIQEINVTKLYL